MRTSELLRRYSVRLKKSLSQNFLSDERVARRIVEHCDLGPDDVVVEIGAGAGTLTEELAKTGAKVVAFEIDTDLKELLEDRLERYGNVELRFEDFLKADISDIPDGFVYVSNIPYGITGLIIEKILKEGRFSKAVLMVQKEVADRMTSRPGARSFGYMSALVQTYCEIEKLFDVSRSHFVPNPGVDSRVLRFTWKGVEIEFEGYAGFLSELFSKKRKTVRNNLKGMVRDPDGMLSRIGIDPKKRPEDLSVEEIVSIYREVRG